MLRVSRLTDYATLVMSCLAAQPDTVSSAAQVAEMARLEAPTASKLLKLLGHAGLVESFRGASGGYRLARPPESISVAEVVEAVEGPIGMTDCGNGSCDREPYCGVRVNWQRINSAITDALRSVSIAEMAGSRTPEVARIPIAAVRRAGARP